MSTNITPQYISLIFTLIVLAYSSDMNMVPTTKNRLFRGALHSVWIGILATNGYFLVLDHYRNVPLAAIYIVVYACFTVVLCMPVIYMLYLIAVIYETDKRRPKLMKLALLPLLAYYGVLGTNPFHKWLFIIESSGRLALQKGYTATWMLPFFYIFAMIIIVALNRRYIDPRLNRVLVSYPIIAGLLMIVEYINGSIILSGTAASASLMIVYLFMQNKHIVMDELTGLANRRAFSEKIAMNIMLEKPMQLILVSLTQFKDFNDRYGTMRGDDLLRQISAFMRQEIARRLIYRYSGDEFVIIIENSRSLRVSESLSLISRRFNEAWQTEHGAFKIAARIATVNYPQHAHSAEEIINTLEYAGEKAKGLGENGIYRTDDETIKQIVRHRRIVEIIKNRKDSNDIQVVYQPIYSLQDSTFHHGEALMRMHDNVLGDISPVEFIPIAEETGLIIDLGYDVIRHVCRFCCRMEADGISFGSISINLSSQQIFAENFIENTLRIIRDEGVSPEWIVFEITESVFIDRVELAAEIMDSMIELGFRFHLDDLGTGYSNLSSVVELPFRAIKLDKSLLYKSMDSERARAVLGALVDSFSRSGMKIIVEGVETEKQQDLVEKMAVDYIQGYRFARPMPEDKALQYMNRKWEKGAI